MSVNSRSKTAGRAIAILGATGIVAGTTLIALALASNTATAAPALVTLNYTCTFPLIGEQALSVTISGDLPDSAVVGVPTDPFTFSADVEVPEMATEGLALVGATTVSGTAAATATLTDGDLNLPLQVPLTVPSTPVPSSGSFTVHSTGTAPSITLSSVGDSSILVGDFSTTLTPLTADGQVTGLGTFESDCTLVPGQNNILATFPVIDGGGGTTTTDTTTTDTTTDTTTTDTTTTEPTDTTTTTTETTTTEPTETTTTAPTAEPTVTTTTAPAPTAPTVITTSQLVGLAGNTTGGGSSPARLPFTGVSVLGPVLAGFLLIGAGVAALLFQRRRRSVN
jgi:hypothetical protein